MLVIYREAGQFKTTLRRRSADLPDPAGPRSASRLSSAVVAFVARAVWSPTEYWLSALLTPFLIFSLATLGLNILTGYAGQLSLGHGRVHGGGRVHGLQLRAAHARHADRWCASSSAGVCAALVGIVFGLPSLRIKGFYLAVATLAASSSCCGRCSKVGWFSNHSASGVITAQKIEILGYAFETPAQSTC